MYQKFRRLCKCFPEKLQSVSQSEPLEVRSRWSQTNAA